MFCEFYIIGNVNAVTSGTKNGPPHWIRFVDMPKSQSPSSDDGDNGNVSHQTDETIQTKVKE